MKHLLLDLSSDVLGVILSFGGVAHCPLLLWKCGSKALQLKLSQSVRILKLETTRSAPIALPKFISSLRALRELHIERGDFDLLASQGDVETMYQLASTLEKLVFRVSNWQKILLAKCALQAHGLSLPSVSSSTSESLESHETVLHRLTSLRELELGSKSIAEISWVAGLPPTLTSLTCGFRSQQSTPKETFEALPKSLTHIGIYSQTTRTLIPGSSLRQVDLGWDLTNLVALLPSVTELTWLDDDMVAVYGDELVESLPSSLTRFNRGVYYTARDSGCTKRFGLAFQYQDIPMPRMNLMRDISMPFTLFDRKLIQSLPSTLRTLIAIINWKDVVNSDWPSGLRSLNDCNSVEKPSSAESLPPSLTQLQLRALKDPNFVIIIPSSITSLAINSSELLGEYSFPPFLYHLSLCACELVTTKILKQPASATTASSDASDAHERSIISYPPSETEPSSPPPFIPDTVILRCFSFQSLPATIVELSLDDCEVPFSKIRFLPPCLRLLSAEFIHDVDFDPRDPELYVRVQYLAEEARKSGFLISPYGRPTVLPSTENGLEVSVSDLLPRTLQIIYLHTDPIDCLDRLPPRLKLLHLTSEVPFTNASISQIPIQHMKEIFVNCDLEEHDAIMRSLIPVSSATINVLPRASQIKKKRRSLI